MKSRSRDGAPMCGRVTRTLAEKAAIPMVRAELDLIIEVQTDEYWQDITLPVLEDVRANGCVVKFIEQTKTPDDLHGFHRLQGEEQEIELPGFDSGHGVDRFRDKTQQSLKAHENDPVIQKLRFNERLTEMQMPTCNKQSKPDRMLPPRIRTRAPT